MENRHLYRGKRTDTGEWGIGYVSRPHCTDTEKGIKSFYFFEATKRGVYDQCIVLADTICQCTGLKDKNGKLIWENDIVKDLFSDTAAPIRYGSYQNCFDSTKVEHVGFYVDWSGKYNKNYRKDLGFWIRMVDAEIIGNAIDNPELLE